MIIVLKIIGGVVAGLIALAVLGSCGTPTSTPAPSVGPSMSSATSKPAPAPKPAEPTVGQGWGSEDASGDVVLGRISTQYGMQKIKVTVTNKSDKTSNYFITVAAESKDGSVRYDEGLVSVGNLRPGQTRVDEAIFFDSEKIPATAYYRLIEVSRTAA